MRPGFYLVFLLSNQMADDLLGDLYRRLGSTSPDGFRRFLLFQCDVESTEIAFKLFRTASCQELAQFKKRHRAAVKNPTIGVMRHHASCFVCAARRVGRLLEALCSNPCPFNTGASSAIKLEWKKKRAFFEKFVDPRNEIEHIDALGRDKTKFAFFNFCNDRFETSDGTSVTVDESAAEAILQSRDSVVAAIRANYPLPSSK